MPARESVVVLLESRLGSRFDVADLSSGLGARLEQLQVIKIRLDGLDAEIDYLDRKGREHILVLTLSLGFLVLGLVVTVAGVSQGFLDPMFAALAFLGLVALFFASLYMAMLARWARRVNLLRIEEQLDLAGELEAGIGQAYHLVVQELASPRRPSLARRLAGDY